MTTASGRIGSVAAAPADLLVVLGATRTLAALIGPIAMAGYWARAVGGSDALGPDLDQHVRAFLEGHAA